MRASFVRTAILKLMDIILAAYEGYIKIKKNSRDRRAQNEQHESELLRVLEVPKLMNDAVKRAKQQRAGILKAENFSAYRLTYERNEHDAMIDDKREMTMRWYQE